MDPKEEIKERLDIAEIIGNYLELRSAGMAGYKAICPFHQEKSPSFHVSREKQIWHCFGCGKGGDVFSFVMEMEGLDFKQSLELLAEKAGVKLPEYKPKNPAKEKVITNIYSANEIACKLFETLLANHESANEARKYIKQRGFEEEVLKKFRIGFAPNGWDKLKVFLGKKGYSDEMMKKAGLIKLRSNGSGFIDQFRNRITVPIRNTKGEVCGFTARALSKEDKGPKYINTPETEIYKKRSMLYGLFEGRTAIRSLDKVIIVEGNLDVIASHQAGIENVVASSGTALTEEQLNAIKRFTKNLLFCFDTDAAGFNAAQRGINLARNMGFVVEVLQIPDELGKDPDEVIKKGVENWKKIVDSPISIMQFYFDRAFKIFDINPVDGKRGLVDMLMPEISKINNLVAEEYWLQKLADIIRIDYQTLKQSLAQYKSKSNESIQYSTQNTILLPRIKKKLTSRHDRLERLLLGLNILKPDLMESDIDNTLLFIDEVYLKIYKVLKEVYSSAVNKEPAQKNNIDLSTINDQISESEQNVLRSIIVETEQMIAEMDQEKVRQERLEIIADLEQLSKEAHQKNLIMAIREAERQGDAERLKILMQEYQKLIS